MRVVFDAMTPVDILVLSGILGTLFYTAHIYRIRARERTTASQAQKTGSKSPKSIEKSQRDEMDREPGGMLSFIYTSPPRA